MKRAIVTSSISFITASLTGLAAGHVSADAHRNPLTEIVVTAAGFEQSMERAPASVSVVGREALQSMQYRDLAEALKNVEGIDVRGGTGKTGGLNVSIRGMPSDYTLFLIDGRRQNAPTEVGQNGFGDALTSFMPPASAIERIEVIRGPMSTLYGSDAMGGVVNIITRPTTEQWRRDFSMESSQPESSRWGASNKVNAYVSGPLIENQLGLALRGSGFRRQDSDRVQPAAPANTRDPAPVKSRQHSLGGRLTWTPDSRNELSLDTQQDRTWYDNSDCRLGGFDFVNCDTGEPTTRAPGYKDALRFNRDQSVLAHRYEFNSAHLDSSLTWNHTEFLGRTIASTARPAGHPQIGEDRTLRADNQLFDTKLVAPLRENHTLTLGGQVWRAKLNDSFLQDPQQTQDAWSLFVEDEWQLRPDLIATIGLRYDYYEQFGGSFTPRAYLVWSASDAWTFKGGSGRGFMAPQMHFVVDGISEVIRQGRQPNVGNPDLEPEYSTNTEVAALYQDATGIQASATAFYNRIEDKISFRGGNCVTDPIPACVYGQTTEPFVTEYPVNMDRGKAWGLELSASVPLSERWALSGNYTWMDTELIEDGQKSGQLSDSANHVANLQSTWHVSDAARVWLQAEYRGSSRRFDGDPDTLTGNDRLEYLAMGDLSAYSLFNLGGAYQLTDAITINANIFNLLDRDFTRHKVWTDNAGDERLGSPYYRTDAWTKGSSITGRTFWVSMNMSF